jgi:hypothetical protein
VDQWAGVGIEAVSVLVDWGECHHTDDGGENAQINNLG